MNSAGKMNIHIKLENELQQNTTPVQQYFFIDDHITISFNKENNWLYVDWIGYQTEASVISGCEKMLEALTQFKVNKVLNDNTKVIGIWTSASSWVGSNWLPRMKQAGLQYFAWVYSPSIMSQVSTNETIKHTPLPELVKTFYSIEPAKEWLTSAQ